ncbi:MAG TPA: S41 family peptidase [Patescibacteria group bacterium]|nr:S41 family peptidase [Patescibacteria group bacterium]
MDTPEVSDTNTPNKKFSDKIPASARKIAAGLIILGLIFYAGFAFGAQKLKINGQLHISKGTPPPSGTADYSLLWDALDQLNSKYVDRPLDQQKLLYGAISGLVSAAGDPYTVYFDPQQAKDFADQLSGTFEGIGAEVGEKNNQLVIIAPLDDTPAQKAGLQAGDAILAINGESTSGMTVDEAVSKIRGTANTQVTLSILHVGQKSAQDIKITRAQINVKSVNVTEKDVNNHKLAIITVSQFGDDTKGLFDAAVEKVLADGDNGIILDLRNNPGGYLDTAVSIASNWVDSGQTVVQEKDYAGNIKQYPASGVNQLKGIQTVVLVNGGSASASEILSGALQDYKLATLIGEKTFGKGSVQELSTLKDNSELKITVAKWLTPQSRAIDKIGLDPDIKVDLTADDVNAGRDPQMDAALAQFK